MTELTSAPARPTVALFVRRHALACFFGLAFLFSWLADLPGLLIPNWPEAVAFLSFLGPAAAALVTLLLSGDSPALGRVLRSLVQWRMNVGWYLLAFFSPFALIGAVMLVYQIQTRGQFPVQISAAGLLLVGMNFLYMLAIVWGEEVGWRGFALPRLQARMHPIAASALLGGLWALWHLPAFLNPNSPQQLLPVPVYLAYVFLHTFLYSFIYNGSRGSLLLSCIHHAATNACFLSLIVFPSFRPVLENTGLFLLVLLVTDGILLLASRGRLLAGRAALPD